MADQAQPKPKRQRKPRSTLRPVADFDLKLIRVGLTRVQLAKAASVGRSTIHAILNPKTHPWRTGHVSTEVAKRLSTAYAKHANMSEEEAFAYLFEDETEA